MSDNKVNMALDDIIKLNKQKAKTTRNVRTGRPIKGGNKAVAKRGAAPRNRKNAPSMKVNRGMNNVETKKLVQKLVKKALKSRGVASTLSRPVAVPNRGGVRSRLLSAGAGLARVNARSRVIGGRQAARRLQVQPRVQVQRRGRGFQNDVEEFYDEEDIIEEPVRVVQQRRPVVVQRVIAAPRNQRVQQRQRAVLPQRVIVQQQPRQRLVQSRQRFVQPRQRFVQEPRQRFVQPRQEVVQQSRQRVVVVPRQQQRQRVIQRVRPQIIERRGPPRRQQVQYVEEARTRKNNNFRSALGLQTSRRVQNVDRFEPSTSFIKSRNFVRRGRGFNDAY